MEDFNGVSDFALLNNLFNNGSHAAVLDENFRVQAVSNIEVEGDATEDWKYRIVDVRLWVSEQGDIIVTFLPYWFGEISNHFIAKLHVSVAQQDGTHGGFRVWVNRHEVRRPQSCLHPSEPMKNLGFFQFGGSTFLLDRVYPTAVAIMNLSLLSASEEQELSAQHNHTFHYVRNRETGHYSNETFAAICMEPPSHDLKSHHSPWNNVTGQWPHFFVHNGPSPVWIDELQLFLGIGHMARGKRPSHQMGYLPDHYTHQFFALDIADNQTFRLAALSPEFCFSSAQDPQDSQAAFRYSTFFVQKSRVYSLQFSCALRLQKPTLFLNCLQGLREYTICQHFGARWLQSTCGLRRGRLRLLLAAFFSRSSSAIFGKCV